MSLANDNAGEILFGPSSLVGYNAGELISGLEPNRRLSRYARVMVATDYEHCVRFEDGLRNSLRVLIAPKRERVFSELVEKAKIAEEVKSAEHLNREKEKGRNKMEAETPGVG